LPPPSNEVLLKRSDPRTTQSQLGKFYEIISLMKIKKI
jgi:hypothetical protein